MVALAWHRGPPNFVRWCHAVVYYVCIGSRLMELEPRQLIRVGPGLDGGVQHT